MLTAKPITGQKLRYKDGDVFKVMQTEGSVVYLMDMETGRRTSAIWGFKNGDFFNDCFTVEA